MTLEDRFALYRLPPRFPAWQMMDIWVWMAAYEARKLVCKRYYEGVQY